MLVEVILAAFRLVAGEVIQDQDRLLDDDALLEIAQKLEKVVGVVSRQQLITGQILHAPPDSTEDACRPSLRVRHVLVRVTLNRPAFLLDHPARELGFVHKRDRLRIVV